MSIVRQHYKLATEGTLGQKASKPVGGKGSTVKSDSGKSQKNSGGQGSYSGKNRA